MNICLKKNIYHVIGKNSQRSKQAHLQFAHANSQPKIAKELASLTHGETADNKARVHNNMYK